VPGRTRGYEPSAATSGRCNGSNSADARATSTPAPGPLVRVLGAGRSRGAPPGPGGRVVRGSQPVHERDVFVAPSGAGGEDGKGRAAGVRVKQLRGPEMLLLLPLGGSALAGVAHQQ